MIRSLVVVTAVAVSAPPLLAQTRPQFEVASVKPSADQLQSGTAAIGVHISGSQVRIAFTSLKDVIVYAYGVLPAQVTGPDWMATERFDISAKLPDGSSAAQAREMMQSLLADRFELKVHHESRELPVFALVAAKGRFTLTPRADAGAPPSDATNVVAGGSANGAAVDLGDGASFSLANNQVVATKLTMPLLANVLTRFMDRPVLDQTAIPGAFDFTLTLTPDEYNITLLRTAANAGVTLPPQAMRALDYASGNPLGPSLEKIGLSLDSRRAPLDVIVVDSVRKTPTED